MRSQFQRQVMRFPLLVLVPLLAFASVRPAWSGGAAPDLGKSCQSNLKQLGMAFLMYAQDYDERFPPANKWCDVTFPYLKKETNYHCPAAGDKKYGYAMNSNLSMKLLSQIKRPADTVMIYETSTLKRNQSGTGKDAVSPARHEGGNNYCYADGHVKASATLPNFKP